jgi:hypothetical protein
MGMEPLRATVAVSLVTLSAAVSATAFSAAPWGLAEPAPSFATLALGTDKNADLIAKFDDPSERAAALEEIKGLANKTPSKVRTYLMKQVGSADPGVAGAAIEAVISIGQPMTRAIKTVLAKGEYKDVAIADFVAARIGLKIDPTGKRMLTEYLESMPLSGAVADEICVHAEPGSALEMLVTKALDEASRPVCLRALRTLRQGQVPATPEGVLALVGEEPAKELGEIQTQVIVDAAVPVSVEEDSARMEAWLTSGEPDQVESALWSIGGVGQSFMDLAPLFAGHLSSPSPTTRHAAHWALRRLAVEAPNAAPEEVAPESISDASGAESAPSQEAEQQLRSYEALSEAKDGVLPVANEALTPEELGAEAVAHWSLAPRWLSALGDTFADPKFATTTPAWSGMSLPSEVEELMPTLMTALADEDLAIAVPAGISLIEWNVTSTELIQWAAGVIGKETDVSALQPIWSLLVRESEEPWLKSRFGTTALAEALNNEATEGQTIKLLERMNTRSSAKALLDHFAGASATDPWDTEHYLALYSIMALSRGEREKFTPLLGERFLAGDYRVAPLLVLGGEATHPALERALKSKNLDKRMIAVAVLVEQGTRARSLLPKLQKLKEDEAHAQSFLTASIKTIETGE